MKFSADIEVDDEFLEVLLDCHKNYSLDSEYFEMGNKQDIEKEMVWDEGLLEGGFYQHYPLSPTPVGRMILDLYLKSKGEEVDPSMVNLDSTEDFKSIHKIIKIGVNKSTVQFEEDKEPVKINNSYLMQHLFLENKYLKEKAEDDALEARANDTRD